MLDHPQFLFQIPVLYNHVGVKEHAYLREVHLDVIVLQIILAAVVMFVLMIVLIRPLSVAMVAHALMVLNRLLANVLVVLLVTLVILILMNAIPILA